MTDPLEALIVDEDDIDRELLSKTLAPYVRLAKRTGTPVFTAEFRNLSANGKIIVFLLARQAGITLGIFKGTPEATPKEISDGTGVKYGTTKPSVVTLTRAGYLVAKDGTYRVATHAVLGIHEVIK